MSLFFLCFFVIGKTRITKFITNRLFGNGRRWNGKSFDAVGASSSDDTMIQTPTSMDNNIDTTSSIPDASATSSNSDTSGSGWNRFEVLTQYRSTGSHKNDIRRRKKTSKTASTTSTTVILKTEKEHVFQYKIGPSRLYPHESSIYLDYMKSQSKLSPWKGMKDEIRILPRSPNQNSMNKYDILIGLGSLSWSGGIYNCSPFCLYRKCK